MSHEEILTIKSSFTVNSSSVSHKKCMLLTRDLFESQAHGVRSRTRALLIAVILSVYYNNKNGIRQAVRGVK